MNLLAGVLYDPSTAATGTTTTAKAITAFDATNLRLQFTVPSHGMARIHIATMLGGAATFPTVLLAVLSGTGIVCRCTPAQTLGNTAVTSAALAVIGDLLVTGLTAGETKTWDAAYGVELPVVATGFQWGGPNNTTADDAFGGFLYEVWDPRPLPTAAPAAAGGLLTGPTTGNVLASVSGLTAANLDAAVTTRMATYTQPTGFLTSTFPTVVAGTTNITVIAAVSGAVGSVTGAVGSVTGNVGGNVIGTVAAVSGLTVANLDATVSSRLATAGYTAPDNTSIATILVDVSGLSVADIAAIKAKTDSLNFTVAGQVDGNAKSMNDTTILGTGTSGDLWRG